MAALTDRSRAEMRSRLQALGQFSIFASAALLILRFLIVDSAGIVDDLYVYFASSRWVVEAGRLYVAFPSEYLLLPNLWFAVPRAISRMMGGNIFSFSIVYVAVVGVIYSIHFRFAASTLEASRPRMEIVAILLAGMSPVLIQLILLRFDFMLVLLVFYALFALKNGRYFVAALLLGLAIAAKGYPLVYVPAVAAYIGHVRHVKSAFWSCCVMALPPVLLLGVTWQFAGFDGMMSPFLFHAQRHFDSDSLYQIFLLFSDSDRINWGMRNSVKIGSIVIAIIGAISVRGSLESLARMMAAQTIGLLLLSPVTSPQFILWALPVMYFVGSPRLVTVFCGYALFSNFWLIREFGLPEIINRLFWLANLAFKFWLMIEASASAVYLRFRGIH